MMDTDSGRIRFSVQGGAVGNSPGAWPDLAWRVEALGFQTLYAADHPGETASPFVALAAAAAVTSTLRVGTYVCNVGVRDPVHLAADAATVDQLSAGRLTLGLGAGHTPAEWEMLGRKFPSAADRVTRLEAVVERVGALLADATFAPCPVQQPLPLLIGGNGRRVLRLAGARADVVGLSGLGRTLEDGHRHAVEWSDDAIAERIAIVRDSAAGRPVVLDALVQHLEITDDAVAAAERIAGLVPGLDPAVARSSPFMLLGTVDEIVAEVHAHRDRWGITSYVVRDTAMNDAAQVVAALVVVTLRKFFAERVAVVGDPLRPRGAAPVTAAVEPHRVRVPAGRPGSPRREALALGFELRRSALGATHMPTSPWRREHQLPPSRILASGGTHLQP